MTQETPNVEKAAVVDQNAAERFERVRAHVLEAGPVRWMPHGVADRDPFGRQPINWRTAPLFLHKCEERLPICANPEIVEICVARTLDKPNSGVESDHGEEGVLCHTVQAEVSLDAADQQHAPEIDDRLLVA